MAEPLYGLTEADVATLRELVAAFRRGDLAKPQTTRRRGPMERDGVLFGVADASISGTTGSLTKPGSGTLNVYKFTSTGGTTVTTRDETVHNLSTVARTTDEFTVAVRDYESGRWMAVAGSGGATGHKMLCRFLLDAALAADSGASAAAVLTAQYGEGTAHSTGAITVYNMLTSGSSMYLFSGSSGVAGLAYWDSGTNWRIIQMECP